jgi:hypothetical protein
VAAAGLGLSNDRENLHRADGEPTWIQNADYPACPGCTRTMSVAGQIAVGDLRNDASTMQLKRSVKLHGRHPKTDLR